CGDFSVIKQEPKPGAVFLGGMVATKPPTSGKITSHLDAYEPLTGRKRWSYESKYPLLASVLSTAGGLVFTGDPEGNFFALDAKTGKKLWSFATGSGHRGSPISYSVNGRQFIAAPAAWGSIAAGALAQIWPELADATAGSTVFAFALPAGVK